MTQASRIEPVQANGPLYDQVVALGDANSATLGHLPYAVFEEAATSGCLLAATRNGEVVGYALFALRSRRFEVSLTHLCVRNSERGQGTSRRLVDDIARRHADRRGIRLRCRVDYPAHHMWPRLGFEHWSRRPGRSHAGHELATWWRPLADLSLFDSVVQLPEAETVDDRLVAALDTNIILDLLEGRNRDASLGLAADWMHDHAQLVVTAQVSSELRSGKGNAATARPSTGRPEFSELRANDDAVNESYASLRTADELSTNQDDDLRIVAETAAGGATHLISRDEALLRSAETIQRLTGIVVLRPADFLLALQADSSTAFEPEFIKTSEFAMRRSASLPTVDVLARFTNQTQSERAWGLREQLARTIGHPEGRIEEVTASGIPWVLAAYLPAEDSLHVSSLRSLGERRAYSLLRQLIHTLRQRAIAAGVAHIEITDDVTQGVGRALLDEGFAISEGIWRADVSLQVIGCDDPLPAEFGSADVSRVSLPAPLISRIELERWPFKLFTGTVPCHIVPIQPSYGETLLGYQDAQMKLIETAPEAATARENAYYMARRPGLQAPARILWLVTGDGPSAGVRAMSWLDEVDTGTPERLHSRHARRGVFDRGQVLERATRGPDGSRAATVLLFSRTDVFSEAVSAERARELCPDDIWEQGFGVTARAVSERTAEALYREGMGLHRQTHDG
ncbi:GNAT family N-acetyltransferase [Candidatus Poriferisodalis sp.]|uniref:GNAT family N-acetyltransferase n=1 Tax=Candidatus Poriferisodalis sp. TaxID=3101277 RepID=UPI003B5C4374